MQYLRARYYDPTLGKFTSKDPVAGTLTSAESQNGYSYANNNPVMYNDPSGRFIPLLIGVALIAWAAYDTYHDISTCNYSNLPLDALSFLPVGRVESIGIKITDSAITHIAAKHIAGEIGASTFYQSMNIADLIRASERVAPTLQAHGTYIRTVDAGRAVGIDRATGNATSIYTVITDSAGKLISSYPGR